MNLPIYFGLIIISLLYDLIQLVVSWYTNGILFFASFMVLFITLILGIAQLKDADSLQLKLMLLYIIPVGILAFGNVAGLEEIKNHSLQLAMLPPLPFSLPGVSSDYESAAENHYISMLFPYVARAFAWFAQVIFDKLSEA